MQRATLEAWGETGIEREFGFPSKKRCAAPMLLCIRNFSFGWAEILSRSSGRKEEAVECDG